MERHGLTDRARVVTAAYSDDGGDKAGLRLLPGERPPTAIMTGADVAALGVHRATHELGLAIAALTPVQLTSVDQAGHAMGATAAKMLIERVERRRDRAVRTSMTPRPVGRTSTAAPVTGPG